MSIRLDDEQAEDSNQEGGFSLRTFFGGMRFHTSQEQTQAQALPQLTMMNSQRLATKPHQTDPEHSERNAWDSASPHSVLNHSTFQQTYYASQGLQGSTDGYEIEPSAVSSCGAGPGAVSSALKSTSPSFRFALSDNMRTMIDSELPTPTPNMPPTATCNSAHATTTSPMHDAPNMLLTSPRYIGASINLPTTLASPPGVSSPSEPSNKLADRETMELKSKLQHLERERKGLLDKIHTMNNALERATHTNHSLVEQSNTHQINEQRAIKELDELHTKLAGAQQTEQSRLVQMDLALQRMRSENVDLRTQFELLTSTAQEKDEQIHALTTQTRQHQKDMLKANANYQQLKRFVNSSVHSKNQLRASHLIDPFRNLSISMRRAGRIDVDDQIAASITGDSDVQVQEDPIIGLFKQMVQVQVNEALSYRKQRITEIPLKPNT